MSAVIVVERRLGPSAAGWAAALAAGFAVALVAVALGGGPGTGPVAMGALASSAALHVPAQVLFALAFAGVLPRRGPVPGFLAGALAYVAGSLVLPELPAPVAAG